MADYPHPYQHLFDATREPTELRATARFGHAWHQWSDAERRALVHAWASGRPLLVRGEAGCGKSQLARAAASVLDVELFAEVIHPRFEATDLLYREDHVARLAQAQLLSTIRPEFDNDQQRQEWLDEQLKPQNFVKEGVIWKALLQSPPAEKPEVWPRAVVLIDEIDKADSDVPNTLLDVLAHRSFEVPGFADPVGGDHNHTPLIVITTNEDRELPPPFLRRCAVLNVRVDDGDEARFVRWLLRRARAHAVLRPLDCKDGPNPMQRAAAQVWDDRHSAKIAGLPTVGLAEYLDLLYSLNRLSAGDPALANALLDEIAPFALVKHREQDQGRQPYDPGGDAAKISDTLPHLSDA